MTDQQSLNARDLGDGFAVALLKWPALIGAMSLGQEGWALRSGLCWAHGGRWWPLA